MRPEGADSLASEGDGLIDEVLAFLAET